MLPKLKSVPMAAKPTHLESVRDPGSSGFCATRRDASTMKVQMAFCAMASSSGMVKQWIGW